MNILAVDCATSVISLAVFCGEHGGHTWSFEADAGLRHSELAMDGIDMLCAKARIKPANLHGVVCMGGPGSFTGLRIGFSVAKGLALSLGIPFAPISTLECIATPHSVWPGLVMPVVDARKNAFFTAAFCRQKRLCEDIDGEAGQIARLISEKLNSGGLDFKKVLLAGPDAGKLYEALQGEAALAGVLELAPNAKRGHSLELIDIARKKRVFDRDNSEWLLKGPAYIRKSDAELNLK